MQLSKRAQNLQIRFRDRAKESFVFHLESRLIVSSNRTRWLDSRSFPIPSSTLQVLGPYGFRADGSFVHRHSSFIIFRKLKSPNPSYRRLLHKFEINSRVARSTSRHTLSRVFASYSFCARQHLQISQIPYSEISNDHSNDSHVRMYVSINTCSIGERSIDNRNEI